MSNIVNIASKRMFLPADMLKAFSDNAPKDKNAEIVQFPYDKDLVVVINKPETD